MKKHANIRRTALTLTFLTAIVLLLTTAACTKERRTIYVVILDGTQIDNYSDEQQPLKHQFKNVVLYDSDEITGEAWFRNGDLVHETIPNVDDITLTALADGTFSGTMVLNRFVETFPLSVTVELTGNTSGTSDNLVYEGTFHYQYGDEANPLGSTGNLIYHYTGSGSFVMKPK